MQIVEGRTVELKRLTELLPSALHAAEDTVAASRLSSALSSANQALFSVNITRTRGKLRTNKVPNVTRIAGPSFAGNSTRISFGKGVNIYVQ
jgi:hypothetical protein